MSNVNIPPPVCSQCGMRPEPTWAEVCTFCLRYMPYAPGPGAAKLPDEQATALLLRMSKEREIIPIDVDVYDEGRRVRRIPRISTVFGPNAPQVFFPLKACFGMTQELLNNPYQFFCQMTPQNGPEVLNQAVCNLTGGRMRRPWYGDILVLKQNGQRGERYASNVNWDNDLGNITHFFINSTGEEHS
ncbi:hypothetical protein RhiJN_09897 [Ceratobasidium sp. AG-Ba]|nr:hypothetical protein RhiJN_09897 [Ceratobasidium sp. AG-Ba]QRW10654.1 hypothetical protein RhiLY_09653 [Ceratobasidium sp. AG-Ba]